MKRKLLLPILSVCMVVALVSVGFAAWLITGADTSDDAQGQFVTYGVDNEYFTVKIGPTDVEDTKIVFGKKNVSSNKSDWFQWAGVEQENLSKEFTVTVTFDDLPNKDDDSTVDLDDAKGILSKWDITLNMITADSTSGDNKDAYQTAINSNYIAEPKFYVNYSETNKDAATVTGTTIIGTLRTKGATSGESGGMKLTITDWKGTGEGGAIATDSDGKYFVQAKVKVEFYWGTYFGKGADGVTTNTNPETFFLGTNFANNPSTGTVTGYTTGSQKYDALDNAAKEKLREEAQNVMSAINKLSAQQFTIYLGATVKSGS